MAKMSRNPAFVMMPTRAPFLSRIAFSPSVVPWTNSSIPSAGTGRRPKAAMTPAAGSSGVVGSLNASRRRVLKSKVTTSMNVPPMSMDTL